MSKTKISLRRLFSNTKFLIVFSIVVAFIFWIVVALQYAPIIENTIKDVPVTIDLKNSVPDKMGLQIFGQKDFKVDVNVSGNRYIVGGDLLNANDFEVTAQTAYVNSSGNYSLKLKVTAKDPDSDFDIVSLSSDYIEVYFDQYEEKDIPVTPRIVTELEKLTDSDYLFNEKEIIFDTKTVHIAGAKTEVDRISKGYIDIGIDDKLKESVTAEATVSLDNGLENGVRFVTVNGSENFTVPVTLPVYKVETLPTSVTFNNAPADYVKNPLAYTCYPARINVAVLQNGGSNDTVSVGNIDFSQLSPSSNSFSFKAEDIENVKILDGTKTITVKVNTSGLSAITFDADPSAVMFSKKPKDKSVSADTSLTGKITVVGKPEDIAVVLAEDIVGNVDSDLTKQDINLSLLPVKYVLKNGSSCWIYGDYTVSATIK